MSTVRRLTLVLAATAALAAVSSPAAADCRANHNKTCADSGAHCGTKQEPGICQTLYRRTWRHTDVSCNCRPTNLHHGGIGVP
jgi:hypothetical protein